ncbi:MAG TPA: diacylglycerol kinase family protein [Bacillota bacterium]|jgi:diacylglycerol kinase
MNARKPFSGGSDWPAEGRSFFRSFAWALAGVASATRRERNLKLHWLAAYLVLAAGSFLDFLVSDWLWVFLAITLVISTELINTAVEAAVDHAGGGPSPLARLAKDAAAGAVLITSLFALIVLALVVVARNPDPRLVLGRLAQRPFFAGELAAGFIVLAYLLFRPVRSDG